MRYFLILFSIILVLPVSTFAQHGPVDSLQLKAISEQINKASNQGDYSKAASLLKKMLALGVRDSSVYYGIAIVTALGGDKAEGKKYLDTAIMKGWNMAVNGDAARMIFGLANPDTSHLNSSAFFTKIEQDAHVAARNLPRGSKNHALYVIYYEDQHEREPAMQMAMNHEPMDTAYLLRLSSEDLGHRKAVYRMLKNRSIKAAPDLQEAALILQHGNDTTDFWTAHELALRSVKLGNDDARWLAAATLDRYLMTKGLPQKYGTQSVMNPKTGKLELYKVDPTVTDSMRAVWHVPPLKDAMNLYKK